MTGTPDVAAYGDTAGAWSPLTGGGGGELVDVRYTPPMFVTAVEVHESFSTGAGPARCCSPRHRMPFTSRNEGPKRVLTTWREICGWPCGGALTSVAALLGPAGAAASTALLVAQPIWAGTRRDVAPPAAGVALAPATTVATRFPSERVDKIRLGFTTPSWVEVDAVRVYGRTWQILPATASSTF